MQGAEVDLEQILQAREDRAARQKLLLGRFGEPLISFTMNIPGPVKDNPLIRFAFRAGLAELQRRLGGAAFLQCLWPAAGCQAFLVYPRPAAELKAVCMAIEEEGEIGRLYDLDVLGADGVKLSRGQERKCLICGGPAMACARSRAHGLDALTSRTERILADFAAQELARLAGEALLEEVYFTPKPGLVDQRNNGAHRDMDLALFQRSALALAPSLRQFARLGLEGASPLQLREAGLEGERAMFAATGGVNTHKGAIYSMALLLSASGETLARGGDLFALAARRARALPPPVNTNGSTARRRYGIGGVREEAAGGYPALRACWRVLRQEGALAALLWSMAHLEDTNLYHRGGAEGAAYVRQAAADILSAPSARREALALALDDQLILRNLSPGGSADVLALALLLEKLEGLLEPGALGSAAYEGPLP